MINVTKTYLPPIEDYFQYIQKAYKKNRVANHGDLVRQLTEVLKNYLEVPNMVLTTNGTVSLQIAIKALELTDEIITTPFSYVATTSVIKWQNCTPVFVDIHPEYLSIDENKIEAAITEKTTAILACHTYGNPCNIEAIEKIAKKHNLKVIYDAAHCFGVKYKGKSIFNYGDVSICSFHATKVFHTGEGGAMITQDKKLHEKLFLGHNFGHTSPVNFKGEGINGKMTELHAAMGLAVFKHLEMIFKNRRRVTQVYDKLLNFNNISKFKIREGTEWNYAYYPIILRTEKDLLKIVDELNKENIIPRRYFYPSLNTLDYVDYKACPISESISKRILCLPLYSTLENKVIERISRIINEYTT